MKKMKKSFDFAKSGLIHAVSHERNLQLFLPVYTLVLILALLVGLLTWEWLALLIAGSLFLSVELINTAIERLADVLDEERKLLGRKGLHEKMKATKDVAAAASLVNLVVLMIVIVTVFFPYINIYILH